MTLVVAELTQQTSKTGQNASVYYLKKNVKSNMAKVMQLI